MNVYWLIRARESLRSALHGQQDGLAVWLPRLNRVLADIFPDQVVLVRERYSGYRPFSGLAILFVEIQPLSGSCRQTVAGRFTSPGTYIVKIAFNEQLAALQTEILAWNAARPDHFHSDNVFVSLTAHPNDEAPQALIYGDANAVLGEEQVMSLETAIGQACRFGVPLPESIERVLNTVYNRLNRHFFVNSHDEGPAKYLSSDKPSLQALLDRYDQAKTSCDPDHANDPHIRRFRRETLSLLASQHDQFADPIDLLGGLKRAGCGPVIRRGTAHGDLHARNIQVSVERDEVNQVAIYDYERFGLDNFIAWDFIKLEIEVAVRLLDEFADLGSMPRFVQQCLDFWVRVARRTENVQRHLPTETNLAANEVDQSWRRLEDLIVSIRLLAREYLGHRRERVYTWLDEYDFLLALHSTRAALYPNYTQRLSVAALIAGGVAARRLIRQMPAEVELSHRRRYLAAKALARGKDSTPQGAEQLKALVQQYPHVLELQEELALAHIKLKQFEDAEDILKGIADQYDHTSAETPSLLGSLWKRRALASDPPDTQKLQESLKWYRRAVERNPQDPQRYYPLINIATLLAILGQREQSHRSAEDALRCLDQIQTVDFWTFATRGEAKLLMGCETADALAEYAKAVADSSCSYKDRESMHGQIVKLRPLLSESVQSELTDASLRELFQLNQEESLS